LDVRKVLIDDYGFDCFYFCFVVGDVGYGVPEEYFLVEDVGKSYFHEGVAADVVWNVVFVKVHDEYCVCSLHLIPECPDCIKFVFLFEFDLFFFLVCFS